MVSYSSKEQFLIVGPEDSMRIFYGPYDNEMHFTSEIKGVSHFSIYGLDSGELTESELRKLLRKISKG